MIKEIDKLKQEFKDVTLITKINEDSTPIPKVKTKLFGDTKYLIDKEQKENQIQVKIGSFIERIIHMELQAPIKEHLTVRDIIRYESQKTMLKCLVIIGFIPFYFLYAMKKSKKFSFLAMLPITLVIYNLRLPIKNYHLRKNGQLMLYCIDKHYKQDEPEWSVYKSFMNENNLFFI